MEANGPGSQEPEWLQNMPAELRLFIDAPITIAGSLYRQLPIDEQGFTRVAAIAWEDGRAYYLYGAADELCKGGTAVMRWGEFLSGPDDEVADDLQERHINRLVLEAVLDEQRMWQRKLVEWLTNLICFSATNEQAYYRLFLASQAYDCALAELADLSTYYSCDSANTRVGLGWIRERVARDMPAVDPRKCWFLRREVFKKLPEQPGRMFASMARRFSRAMKEASADERLCLGVSYLGGFGESSWSLHPVIAHPHVPTCVRDVQRHLKRVSLLCMNIVNRAHQLAGLQPLGLAKQVCEHFAMRSEAGSILAQRYQPGYEEGDLVLAMGHLADVLEKRVSEYGLESYRVKFLVRGPLEETPEDCVPADSTYTILRKSWSREYLRHHWSKLPETQDLLPLLDSRTDEELTALLKAELIKLQKAGVPLLKLAPPDDATE